MMRWLRFLTLALCVAFTPPAAQAHDGVHSPDMLAVVDMATIQGHKVTLTLTVTGLRGPLVLTGLSAPGAQRIDLDPVYIDFAQDVAVRAVLDFGATPPGFFSLDLDFGPSGHGTVSVIPAFGG